jgi:hypothetical protein
LVFQQRVNLIYRAKQTALVMAGLERLRQTV